MNVRSDMGTILDEGTRVAAIRRALPPEAVIDTLAQGVFGVLSEPSRLRLIIGLLEAGELCVGDAAAVAGLSESATSHALRLLRAHGVVQQRCAGRLVYYSLSDGHVHALLRVALEHVEHL